MVKRLFDIVVSFVALVLLLPIMVIVAAAIAIESGWPVIFTQKRVGKDNVLFVIYKFRSMKLGTPNVPTDQMTKPEAYITRVGRFIRKTSVDELPQLFNVLFGQMSLVGPRPALFNQYSLTELRTQRGIHRVRPGLTGWAQVNGRDELSDEEKVRLDEYYCQHMSFWFDFKILLMTAGAVSTARGVKA